MTRAFLFVSLSFALFSMAAYAEGRTDFNGQLAISIEDNQYQFKDLPKFSDFPPEKETSGKIAADIDWSSNERARTFKTRLREGLKRGANFNGHYAVIMQGCGSPCQVYWIVDVNNGKVAGSFDAALGASYSLESSLIAGNLVSDQELQAQIEDGALYARYIDFYKVENGKMEEVKIFDVYKEIEEQKKKK
jgi:hypothetical protein